MVFIQERKIKGTVYVYLEKSVRIGKKVHKISKYLGKKNNITKIRLKKEIKKFTLELNKKIMSLLEKESKRKYSLTKYSLTLEEINKLESMNLKYKEIKRNLNKKDWGDIKKRFVANFVFESNALEGNSLTLRNFSRIILEEKTSSSVDLREVYDAKNSYEVFSKLFEARGRITEKFVINLHKKIMNKLDERVGYKKLPNIILGRNLKLAKPENVPKEMAKLLEWYYTNEGKIHSLELALRFHHQFEQIHPFADGNRRVGRMLMNYILIKRGYYPIIIRKSHRNRYIKALEAADGRNYVPLIRFGIEKAKETYRKFFEVYYQYL